MPTKSKAKQPGLTYAQAQRDIAERDDRIQQLERQLESERSSRQADAVSSSRVHDSEVQSAALRKRLDAAEKEIVQLQKSLKASQAEAKSSSDRLALVDRRVSGLADDISKALYGFSAEFGIGSE